MFLKENSVYVLHSCFVQKLSKVSVSPRYVVEDEFRLSERVIVGSV